MSSFESIFEALNDAGVRYVVVGGLATVLHGYARLTVDVDLIVDLAPDEAAKAIATLTAMGFRPRAPVAANEFADAATRARWIRENKMQVFPMVDPVNPMRQIDLFIETPIDFHTLWQRAQIIRLDRTPVRVASIADLIALKRLAGRPQDLTDIEALEAIAKRRESDDEVCDPQGDWQVDWEEHRRWQLTAASEATPAQRLAWLEEMIRLAHRSGAVRPSDDPRRAAK